MSDITRRKLYEMVWEEPVEDVAAKFGISGRGLAKLCERHSIPVPPRGYWQKRSAGRASVKPPLLIEAGDEAILSLIRRATGATPPIAEKEAEPSQPVIDEFFALYTAQVASCDRVRTTKRVAGLHPVVALWQAQERRYSENDWELRRRYDFTAKRSQTSPLQKRMWFLQDALFRHLESQGFRIDSAQHGMNAGHATLRVVSIEFALKERIKQYRRPLTVAEQDIESPYRNQKFRQVKEPTGELVFSIQSPMPSTVPARWQDEGERLLEDRLIEMAAGFAVAVAYSHKRSADSMRAAEIRNAAREEAACVQREQEREARRREKLGEQAEAWQEVERLRAYIAAVEVAAAEGRAPNLQLPLPEWLEWARRVADEKDPFRRASDV